MTRRYLQFGASVLLLGSLLPAATLERLSLEEMILKSTAIVRGRVLNSHTAPYGPVIYTHYNIQITERWKGPADAAVDVVVPGGVSGGQRQTFSGAPAFGAGSEYILFLWTSRSGLTHVIGLTQGIFEVKRNHKGDLVAMREASTEPMLDAATGLLVKDEAVSIRLTELRQRIVRTLIDGGHK